jgi:hypothetical protein
MRAAVAGVGKLSGAARRGLTRPRPLLSDLTLKKGWGLKQNLCPLMPKQQPNGTPEAARMMMMKYPHIPSGAVAARRGGGSVS